MILEVKLSLRNKIPSCVFPKKFVSRLALGEFAPELKNLNFEAE